MGGLLTELGKRLAEQWFSLLVVPGALYLAALTVARVLGHTDPFGVDHLVQQLDTWASSPALDTSGLLVVLLAVLLAAAAAGLAAQALGSAIEQCWLAPGWPTWPSPLRRLAAVRVAARRERWHTARRCYQEIRAEQARRRALGHQEPLVPSPLTDLDVAHQSWARIALEAPSRPTWMGDRVHAVTIRMDREYELDLTALWPQLWLVLPDSARTDLTTARDSLSRATTLAGWGVLYLLVGALWWPGIVVSAAVIATARGRARTATEEYALLVEASVRLYSAELARQLGVTEDVGLERRTGRELSFLLQGQGHLVPLIRAADSEEPVGRPGAGWGASGPHSGR